MSSTSRKRFGSASLILGVLLLLALCGGVATAVYAFLSPEGSSVLRPEQTTAAQPAQPSTFTTADTGACLNWQQGPNNTNTNFAEVPCDQPHRFEISVREDLAQYPTSEFSENAPMPDVVRQEQLTTQLCTGPTLSYLHGRLDPEGRYSISPILPPPSAWDRGDRTMLCGVMVVDAAGMSVETTGHAAIQDQSNALAPDSCVRADGDTTFQVPCDQDHSWQVTSVVNLAERFPDVWPTVEEQNEFLNGVCTDAARAYLGDDDALYRSTLTPFWTTLKLQSWDAGSRNVNCALTFGRAGGGFANLAGDARHGFTIDGLPPEERPARPPLRDPAVAPVTP